jgi:signal transduction histidine kinase
LKKLFLFLFIVLSVVLYSILDSAKQKDRALQLQHATSTYLKAYQTIYQEKKNLSLILFSGFKRLVDVPFILQHAKNATKTSKDQLRQELYMKLKDRYSDLAKQGLKQFHFHLPNGESFLRLHSPEFYGDNILPQRDTLRYVIKHQKPIDGFEEGCIYNGFRFVYPLFADKEYVGSVELSFGAELFTSSIMQHYNVLSNFYVNAEVVANKTGKYQKSAYAPSHHKGFLYDKNVLHELKKVTNKEMKKLKPKKSTTDQIRQAAISSEPTSIFDSSINQIYTIIPIFNPITKVQEAFLTIRSQGYAIGILERYFFVILFLSIALLGAILYIIYFTLQKNKILSLRVKKEIKLKLEAINHNQKQQTLMIQLSKMAELGEMLGAITHQWRQPLNVLTTRTDLLEMDFESGQVDENYIKHYSTSNHKTIEFMNQTVDDFLNFFKPSIQKKQFDICNTIAEVTAMVEKTYTKEYIKVINSGANGFEILGYRSEFKQVILNIFNNAKEAIIAYNPPLGGEICCQIQINKNIGIIKISDNGGGIEPKLLPDRIFQSHITSKKKGTGIGLSISKMIIEDRLGGKLWAHNTADGAEFVIELPLAKKQTDK